MIDTDQLAYDLFNVKPGTSDQRRTAVEFMLKRSKCDEGKECPKCGSHLVEIARFKLGLSFLCHSCQNEWDQRSGIVWSLPKTRA